MDVSTPVSVTLSQVGAGTASIRGVKLGMTRRVAKVDAQLTTAGSGTVELQRDGRRLAIRTLAPRVVATGSPIDLFMGQQLDVVFNAGPPLAAVVVTFHYEDIWE